MDLLLGARNGRSVVRIGRRDCETLDFFSRLTEAGDLLSGHSWIYSALKVCVTYVLAAVQTSSAEKVARLSHAEVGSGHISEYFPL